MKLVTFALAILLISGVESTPAALANKAKLIEVGPGRFCKWSPDGRYLSFANKKGLQLYVVDSGTVRQIASDEEVSGIHEFNYEWSSPNELTVIRDRRTPQDGVVSEQLDYIIVTTNGVIRVAYSESVSSTNYFRSRPRRLNTGQVTISRESAESPEALTRLRSSAGLSNDSYYVISNASAWHTHYWGGEMDTDVWLVRADGSPYKRVTTGKRYGLPTLSPDGLLIMCQIGMVVLDLDGNIVGQFQGNVELSGWFVTCKRVLYTRSKEANDDVVASDIFISDTNAENEVQITATPGKIELDPVMSPDMTKIAYRNYAPEGNFIEILDFGEVIK